MSGAEFAGWACLGFGIGFLVGLILLMVIETRHDWGKWKEIRPLTKQISGEYGSWKEEHYRRFERECKDCGIVDVKKLRID